MVAVQKKWSTKIVFGALALVAITSPALAQGNKGVQLDQKWRDLSVAAINLYYACSKENDPKQSKNYANSGDTIASYALNRWDNLEKESNLSKDDPRYMGAISSSQQHCKTQLDKLRNNQ